MYRAITTLLTAFLLVVSSAGYAQEASKRVRVETSMGSFVVELAAARAPLTVDNFLRYVRDGHYNGTIFHRVINNFVAQGGGYDEQFVEKPTQPKVPNESGNGLSNRRGTVGMARTGEAHSADAQFYINLADNSALDPQPSRWGYTVFGRVVEGMDVIDGIGAVATGHGGTFDSDVPIKPVIIQRIVELD